MRHRLPWLLPLLAIGCGSDDSSTTVVLDPPKVQILELQPAGGAAVKLDGTDPPCIATAQDGDATVAVKLGPLVDGEIENWTLRAPGLCQSQAQCGLAHLQLSQDGDVVATSDSMVTTATISMKKAADGEVELRVTLRDERGVDAVDLDGKVIAHTVEFRYGTGCDTAEATAGLTDAGGAGSSAAGGAPAVSGGGGAAATP